MNESKKKQKRFWDMWRKAGAIGRCNAKKDMPPKISTAMLWLAKKSFALAIAEALPGVRPMAEDVEVTPGILSHTCVWSSGNNLGDCVNVRGSFYHYRGYAPGQASVCLAHMFNSGQHSFPHSWHHLFFVHDEYEEMMDVQVNSWDDLVCPECFHVGRVAKNHIGGGAEFGGDECYCYNCCTTFSMPCVALPNEVF